MWPPPVLCCPEGGFFGSLDNAWGGAGQAVLPALRQDVMRDLARAGGSAQGSILPWGNPNRVPLPIVLTILRRNLRSCKIELSTIRFHYRSKHPRTNPNPELAALAPGSKLLCLAARSTTGTSPRATIRAGGVALDHSRWFSLLIRSAGLDPRGPVIVTSLCCTEDRE